MRNELVLVFCSGWRGNFLSLFFRYLGAEEPPVLRESCVVALDMADYANSEEFQYANTLSAAQ